MLTKADKDQLREIFTTKEEFNELKNMMIEMWGEIKAMREEIAVFAHQQVTHTDQLEIHEKRLRGLELGLLKT